MEKIPKRSSFSSSPMVIPTFIYPLFFFYLFTFSNSAPTKPDDTFTPQDNYNFNCGSNSKTTLPDNTTFIPDQDSNKFSHYTGREIQISVPPNNDVTNPIYLTAKVFVSEATYTFQIARPGWHWIRLHFFPVKNNEFNLQDSKFTVTADHLVLLHDFGVSENKCVMKEYLVNVTHERFSIKFTPTKTSYAFVNGIELVSAPDMLIPDSGSSLFPVGPFAGLSSYSYMTVYRLNMGGPVITPGNDTLGRTWEPDRGFAKVGSESVSVSPSVVNYPEGTSALIGPRRLYSTASQMGDAGISGANFNITWSFDIDTAFSYFVRLHFCDIVSKSMNDLYFNVYVGGKMAISALDLSTATGQLSSAYFKDVVVNSSLLKNPFTVQIGPMNQANGARNAILNGLEILKINNSVNSLDGEFGFDGSTANGPPRETVAAVGFAMMFGAFVGLGAMAVKWQRRPRDWQERNSFSSWLLPLHSGDSSYMSKRSLDSRKGHSSTGLGRYFSLTELTEATKNWDQNAIIGVGGFGNVYVAEIDDGTKVAVKRGNPQSEQGINEFETEIQMLSKLRHRHLVSLIGYCDENSEMILVYEFMLNGPLRDHLYGKSLPSLSWKQRLEICIGAARGLHYLHTGSSRGIIHRDVKSTNILLDENFVAKMADFGLSKDAGRTSEGQTHVSTAVKGSFGYLDPEYFRKQQLTDKSDVYSFGVVMLEVLCARPAINPALPREQVNLAEWALQWKRKGLMDKIVDPTVVENIDPESLAKFTDAAEKCLSDYGVDRPTMGDVLWNLESALHLQEASSKGKSDEASAGAPPSPSPGPAPVLTPTPIPAPTAAQGQEVNEHSGTTMFTQFAELNGR